MPVERQGKPQHRSRGEGGKQSDAAHLHITSFSTHQKRPLESDFSEVPVTSSGQLFYSDVSNGAKPGNFPISSREATQQGSVKVDLKGNFEGFPAHSPV